MPDFPEIAVLEMELQFVVLPNLSDMQYFYFQEFVIAYLL